MKNEDFESVEQEKIKALLTIIMLQLTYNTLSKIDNFSHETQEAAMRALADRMGLKAGQLFSTLRVAVTGREVSPPLFETMEILGKDVVLKRIKNAGDILAKMYTNTDNGVK